MGHPLLLSHFNTHNETFGQQEDAPVKRQPTQHTPQDQRHITTSTRTWSRASSLTCTRALSKSRKLQCALVKEQSVVKEKTECKTGCRCSYSRKRRAPCTPRTSRCSQKFGQRNSSNMCTCCSPGGFQAAPMLRHNLYAELCHATHDGVLAKVHVMPREVNQHLLRTARRTGKVVRVS